MRLLSFLALLLAAALAPVQAQATAPASSRFAGIWLFDHAPPTPGVTMMEVAGGRSGLTGSVTTLWYGPIDMADIAISGDRLHFTTRNINDAAHPTRRWTATLAGGRIILDGMLWQTRVHVAGRRGDTAAAAGRRFRFAPLPAFRAVPRDMLAATPPMGWSSWNRFADRIDDATIRAMADAMVSSGLRDAGYRYVNIDDGWQGERATDGSLRPNARFPDMKALADYVHARGLRLGLYSSPGPRTCAGYAGSYGHVAQDARTFAAWGVDYLKYDLCSGEWFYADADTVQRSYAEMGAALKATGRDIVYSLCEYGRFQVSAWGRSVGGHLWRTTGDITDDYRTMADIGFVRNPRFAHAGPGGWNDPDMLEVGNGGMSIEEYRTHLTLWAMSAAPLLMGHDLRLGDAATLALLTNRAVIAIDQDARGIQGRAVRVAGGQEVWTRPLADGGTAIALFNRGETPATMRLLPGDTGGGAMPQLHDLWRGTAVVPGTTGFTVPAHGVVLLRADAA